MGILIRIGGLRLGSSRSGGIPAAIKAKFLFWGKVSEIVGGEMPNKVTGATDYLTITGTGLNARYRTPDLDAYRSADTDNCWWKTDASESTCDGNRLIAYDFARTLVKYDNTSPYTIREIIILKAGEVLTTAEMNFMRDYMQLSIFWDNTSSNYGMTKDNRSGEQSIWIPAPDGLSLTVLSATSIKVDFTQWSGNEDGFLIERSTTDETNYTVVHTNAANVVTWTDTTLTASTKYYYRVRGYKGTSYSAYCTSVFETTSSGVIIQDTFTGADTTRLWLHAPDIGGVAWVETIGVWQITSNKIAEVTAGDTIYQAIIEAGVANVDISVLITIPAADYYAAGIIFRSVDDTHSWIALLERDGTAGTSYVALRLNGVGNNSVNLASNPAQGATVTLRVVANGNSIKTYLNGTLINDITNATHNDKTLVGLAMYRGTDYPNCPMDTFTVI